MRKRKVEPANLSTSQLAAGIYEQYPSLVIFERDGIIDHMLQSYNKDKKYLDVLTKAIGQTTNATSDFGLGEIDVISPDDPPIR